MKTSVTLKRIIQFAPLFFRYLSLPLLMVFFYLLFHYGNNVNIVSLADLTNLILPALLIALVLFLLFFVVFIREPARAGIATMVFLIFFFLYGIIFNWLRKVDIIQIEHFTFLPLYLTVAVFTALATNKIRKKTLNTVNLVIILILAGLIVVNLVRIIPVELSKARMARASTQEAGVEPGATQNINSHPDIYFIILDEAAGFDVIRDYFKYPKVDEFISFLQDNQFYVAEASQAGYPGTLYSLSSRLNYQEYGTDEENTVYFEAITQNKVMAELKARGYTTIVFNELNKPFGFSAMPDIKSDFDFYPNAEGPGSSRGLSGELGQLIINQSMLSPFAGRLSIQDPIYQKHQEMVYLTIDKITKLNDIPAPRFVYVHLMLPHAPFMFDKNGNLNDRKNFLNYNFYLENYIYSLKVAEQMINGILANSDPEITPVIVLQSDHGARNVLVTNSPNKVLLEDYPAEYKTRILNAIRIPGCPDAPLKQDMNPIDTFPIIFNCMFDAGIPLQ